MNKQCNTKVVSIKKDFAVLTNPKQGVEFKISLCDLQSVLTACSWQFHHSGYMYGWIDGKMIALHRFILGLQKDDLELVDHINRDKLDCRRENLRLTTRRVNALNRDSSRKFIGVTKLGESKFRASSSLNHKMVHLGIYSNAVVAALVYDKYVYFNDRQSFDTGLVNIAQNLSQTDLVDAGFEDFGSFNPEAITKSKTTKYYGVHLHKGKYKATVFDGVQIHLGTFDSLEIAVKARELYIDDHPSCKSKRNNLYM